MSGGLVPTPRPGFSYRENFKISYYGSIFHSMIYRVSRVYILHDDISSSRMSPSLYRLLPMGYGSILEVLSPVVSDYMFSLLVHDIHMRTLWAMPMQDTPQKPLEAL
jgi:hypothetical protein